MSTGHAASLRTYLTVFGALLVLTGLTTAVAFVDLGGLANAVLALTIASVKAVLVVLWFMHVKESSRLVQVVCAAGILWLVLFFALLLSDYVTRVGVDGWA